MKWIILPVALTLLSSCGAVGSLIPEPVVVTETEYVEREIPIQPRPEPVAMPDVDWYVVNQSNLEEFLQRINNDVGDVVFIAVTPKGYENLALGIAELRRYILQQQSIIAYYEEAAAPTRQEAAAPTQTE